jgi:protein-S-isoprenylcysteine O-methyltransferase Ste14
MPDAPRAATADVVAPPPLIYGIPLLAGLLLDRWTPWPLIALPAVLLVMQVGVIRREERYLEGLFGDDYRAYRTRVRRWL